MRRAVIAVAVLGLAGLAARVAVPAQARHFRVSAALACGVEGWTVKTLQDRPRLLLRQWATVARLVRLPARPVLPRTRLRYERHVFTVRAAVTPVRREDDGDLHLVLKQGPSHMIAELPSPACTTRATPYRRRQMANARKAFRLCVKATITGVAFFDFKHGQIGLAPNAIELHPILDFVCLVD